MNTTQGSLQPAGSSALKVRLCGMMFLQYFVQGCYLPVVSVYLKDAVGFDAAQLGYFGSALAIGPLFAPLIVGQIVDRRFATQHVLAVAHLLGGVAMLVLWRLDQVWPIIIVGTLYSVLYVPTMMLTNSLAFAHLSDREREFPLIRLWGTIGFIVPAWLIEMVFLHGVQGEALNQARGITLASSGVAGIAMAIYSLVALPHTPPARRDEREFAPAVAARLVFQRRLAVLVAASFVVAIAHKFYFVYNSPFLSNILARGEVRGAWEQRISSIGQIAEIAVMAGVGMLIVRIGFKRTMLIGTLAYTARCLIFSAAQAWPAPFALTLTIVCLGQMLHGVCFGCFLATAYMYLDRTTPGDLRGSVQTLYGTLVLGLGFVAGGIVAGLIGSTFSTGTGEDAVYHWTQIWLAGAALAAVAVAILAVLFPSEPQNEEPASPAADDANGPS